MPDLMFIKVQDRLVNLAHVCDINVDETTVSFTDPNGNDIAFEFDTEEEADAAFEQIEKFLAGHALLLGTVA